MAGESRTYELAVKTFLQGQSYSQVFTVERRNILGTPKEHAGTNVRVFVSNIDRTVARDSRSEHLRDYRVGVYVLKTLSGSLAEREDEVDALVNFTEEIEESIGNAEAMPGITHDTPFSITNEVANPLYDKELAKQDSVFLSEIPVTFTNVR